MGKTYTIYKTPDGKKYKMYPTLVWFNKKTRSFEGEETIRSIIFSDLLSFLSNVVGMNTEENLYGQTRVTTLEDKIFLQPHCSHEINFKKYNYALSFDNVEWI